VIGVPVGAAPVGWPADDGLLEDGLLVVGLVVLDEFLLLEEHAAKATTIARTLALETSIRFGPTLHSPPLLGTPLEPGHHTSGFGRSAGRPPDVFG
jgi:hypothetical protein